MSSLLLAVVFITSYPSKLIAQVSTNTEAGRGLELKTDCDIQTAQVDINLGREYYKKAAIAYILKKQNEGKSWSYASFALYQAAEQMNKAHDAKASGNEPTARSWRKAAQQNQQGFELFTKAAMAYAANNTSEGKSWYDAGINLVKDTDQSVKTEEVRNKKN